MNKLFWLVIFVCAVCLLNGCGSNGPQLPPLLITSGAPPDATLLAAYGGGGVGFPFLASAGMSPYSWTWAPATGSSLPPGLSLTNGSISGTPSTLGTFMVVVTVTDSETPAKQVSTNYTIKVTPGALTIATTALRNGTIGFRCNPHCRMPYPCRPPYVIYGLQLVASGGVSPYTWSWVAATGSSLPPGFTFSIGGYLDGVPTVVGTYNLVVTVTDSQSPAAQAARNLSLTVTYPPPPVVNTAATLPPVASTYPMPSPSRHQAFRP